MIPVNEPKLDGREAELLLECIKTGFISSDGNFVPAFERAMASYVGMKHGIAVCNGTAALEAAVFAANIQPGDEVILPSFTIISCVSAILRFGGVPVLVDCEPDTWNMDVTQIEQVVTRRTKAIMVVHIYGHPVDMDPVLRIARDHNLVIIEDAAEVHGAEYKGRRCGGLGHISTFSFYANKIVTTGEGGMLLTSDDSLAERGRSYRNLCFVPKRRFYHSELGQNFRMTNLQAAIGVAQMERIDEFVATKRRWAAYYIERLSTFEGIKCQVEKPWAKSVYWMYCIELDERLGITGSEFISRLARRGVSTRPFFIGMHEQPVLRNRGLFHNQRFPVTERAARQGLYLPSGLNLTAQQIDCVIEAVGDALKEGTANRSDSSS